MINGEKYRDEILAVTNKHEYFALKEDNPTVITRCNDLEQCRGCLFDNGTCSSEKIRWLLSECKDPAKLTRLEYEILKWLIDKGYKYIARESNCKLIVCYKKPSKGRYCWEEINGLCLLSGFEELLQFIKWSDEEPTFMQDILDSCEVIENDI